MSEAKETFNTILLKTKCGCEKFMVWNDIELPTTIKIPHDLEHTLYAQIKDDACKEQGYTTFSYDEYDVENYNVYDKEAKIRRIRKIYREI